MVFRRRWPCTLYSGICAGLLFLLCLFGLKSHTGTRRQRPDLRAAGRPEGHPRPWHRTDGGH
uniref:Uncharacterized protein n=1 Tax=Anguilla anguilla TaxID=7936 RepID=A0A0E9QHC6_ANGAN